MKHLNLIWASVPKYTKVTNESAQHKLSKTQKVQVIAENAIRCSQLADASSATVLWWHSFQIHEGQETAPKKELRSEIECP